MTLLIIVIFALAIFVYGFFIEPNVLTKTYLTLNYESLPVQEFKIMQISDLHYTRFSRPFKKALEVIKEENPDIVVITGDFISSSLEIKFQDFLAELTGTNNNVIAVLGNWDHNLYDIEPLKNAIIKSGVKLLVNESLTLPNGIVIAGTDDPYFEYDDLEKTFKKVSSEQFVVLLSHAPDIVYKALKYNPKLILTGHLHGGQVKIPFLKLAIYVPSEYGNRFLEGLFTIQGVNMYVNRGIGTSHLRIRIFSPPEITIIKLKK